MTSSPIALIKDASDYDVLVPFKFLGAGTSGCVLLGKLNGVTRVFKCVVIGESANMIMREIFIGQQLRAKLPPTIGEMFIPTLSAYVSALPLPATWVDLMTDDECKEKFDRKKKQRVCILVQEYAEGVVSAHDWLASQEESVSANLIRGVLLQLVIGLSYAQSLIGFQHNDLKLENIMFIPLVKSTTLRYSIGEGDLFTTALEPGDVLVRFIDFGASSLRWNTESPLYLRTTTAFTPGVAPFELSLASEEIMLNGTTQFPSPLFSRHYDADSMGIFHIFMSMMCHWRAKPFSDNTDELWKYRAGKDIFAPFSDCITSYEEDDYSHIESLYKLVATNPVLQNGKKQFDANNFSNVLNLLSLYLALDTYPSADGDHTYVRTTGEKTYPAMEAVYNVIVTEQFKTQFIALEESPPPAPIPADFVPITPVTMWAFVPVLLSDVFGKEQAKAAKSFLSLLCAPTAQDRAAFGVEEGSFSEYLLSNALYHPFLAYACWDRNVVLPTDLPETDAPFGFRQGAKSTSIENEAAKFANDFEDVLKQTGGGGGPAPSRGRKKAKEALPDVRASLETIEQLFEFKTDDAYNLPLIQAELYGPVRKRALKTEAMTSIMKHLGLESEIMFDGPTFAALDMTNESNRTRYFHTLSVVANMLHTNDYAEMDRCFAEWPPKAPFRLGEVNEV